MQFSGNHRRLVSVLLGLFAVAGLAATGVWKPNLAGVSLQRDHFLPPAPPGQTFKLVFSDEFDGATLDETKWNLPEEGNRKGGNWSPRSISLDGRGHLLITTFKDGDRYFTGGINTKGKFERAYGFYICRAKFQRQPGHWSAFWLYDEVSTKRVGDDGRDGTEIDIMEKPTRDEVVPHTLHWDVELYPRHGRATRSVEFPGVMDGFHTFAVWWTPDEYIFYIDGVETWRTSAGGVCRTPLYVFVSDEIGRWGGDIRLAQLPDVFTVDYVRVYEMVEVPPRPEVGW